MIDRIPPQNIEAEQSLISAAMLDPQTIDKTSGIISAGDFYKTDHQKTWDAIVALKGKGDAVDLLTVNNYLKSKKSGVKSEYLASIIDTAPLAANAPHYARIVKESAIRRRLIEDANRLMCGAWDEEDLAQIIESYQQRAMAVTLPHGDGASKLSELCMAAMDRYDELQRSKNRITGLPTGFPLLDWLLTGLQPSNLYILAARPSMGKTSLALCITRQVARKVPVAWFSLEMSGHQLTDGMIAQEAMVDRAGLRRTGTRSGREWTKITEASGRIYSLPVYIDDDGDHDISSIRMRAREMRRRHGIGLFVIDHLQIVRCAGKRSRNDEIGDITRQCKAMAKELGVPVLLLSQLNRQLESRNNPYKRPVLSDLRDSGNIEQDADAVLFIYRPEHYGDACEWPEKSGKRPFAGQAEINVAKQREGPTGLVLAKWVDEATRFLPLESNR